MGGGDDYSMVGDGERPTSDGKCQGIWYSAEGASSRCWRCGGVLWQAWGVEVWVPLEVKRQIHNGFVVVVSFLMFQSSRETLPDSLQLPSRRSKMVFEAHNTKSGEALESIFFSCLRASLMNGYMYVTICARKNVFRV